MKKRNIIVMIILSLVTFGIYPVYWSCSFQNQLKKETGEGFGGFGHFLMCILTFGIYSIYWQYAAGKRLHKLGAENHAVIYLLLALIGLGFINQFLMQSQANSLN